jgi:OOP family OmpA-OmpF porin
MSDILDSLKEHISPELLSEAAKIYGENETGVFKTISCLAPTILAGLLEKCGDSHAIDPVFNSLRNFDTNILQRLDQLVDGNNPAQNKPREIAAQLNSTIFGAKIPAITNAVAAFSGVKPSTATALLGFTSPMVMALLSQKINAEGLRSSALVRYLLGERSRIVSLLPAGVGSLLGMANIDGIGARDERPMAGLRWLWILLALIVLGGVVAYGFTNW